MEDNRFVDGPGIDTQQERDSLNYRPVIEYTKPQINAPFYDSTSSSNVDVILKAKIQPVTVPTWGRAVDIKNRLNQIESDFSSRLKDSYAMIPDKFLALATDAAAKFGYPIQDRKLPFSLYKKVLQSNDSHEKIILQDIFENYQADIGGNLVAELYPDVVEMQEDWTNVLDFMKSGLFAQFVDKTKVPKTNTKDDSNLAYIQQEEQRMSDAYVEAKKISNTYANTMRQIHLIDATSSSFLESKTKYLDQQRKVNDLERRLATKDEVASLVNDKANDAEPLINSINNFANMDAYKNNTFDLLYSLLSQYPSGQDAEKGLRKVQVLLKLSIDGKIESVDGVKTNIRGISNNVHKSNVNKALVKSVHLRNEVYGEVFDTINGFVDPPSTGLFDMVTGHIVDSVERADSIYAEQAGDFYKISALDSELRRDKLSQLVDKDSARRFYQIIDSLVSYAKQRSWPNIANLTSWLKDFINHEGL